jgi:PAS domain-containing protein
MQNLTAEAQDGLIGARDPQGLVVRWCNILTHVDDRKHVEEALRPSELNLRLIVDSVPGLVCTMSAAG